MSLARGIASFIVSTLFITSLYLTITSYTMGNLIQKDSIKSFIQTQTTGELVSKTCEDLCSGEAASQQCNIKCDYLETELKESCIETCLSEGKNICIQMCLSQTSNESQQYIYDAIDEFYNTEIISNINIDDIISIFRNSILFIVLTLIFGFSMFFVSDEPITKLGNKIIVVSIFLLSMVVIPALIISNISFIKLITNYLLEGLYEQLYIGIILLVTGIILIIIGKKISKRKEIKTEEVKTRKKKMKKKSK